MQRTALIDWFLLAAVGITLPIAFATAASSSRSSEDESVGLTLQLHEDMDPMNPPGLPPGVAVDPETGYLVGLDIGKRKGESIVSWARLKSSEYENGIADVPPDVKALHGKPVVIVGFGVPLYQAAEFREFALMGSTLDCCFGRVPGLGGLLKVMLRKDTKPMQMDPRPIVVRGTFQVRELRLSDGQLVLLYHVEAAEADFLS